MTSYSSTENRLENDVTRGAVVFLNAFPNSSTLLNPLTHLPEF
jgi:hypothetical protein